MPEPLHTSAKTRALNALCLQICACELGAVLLGGLSGPKALSSSSGYASALVFVYRSRSSSGQPFLYHLQPVFIRKPTDHAAVDPPRGRRGSGPRL